MADNMPEDYDYDAVALKTAEDMVKAARESGHPEECPDVQTALRMVHKAMIEELKEYLGISDAEIDD
jgi:hypothetical protein